MISSKIHISRLLFFIVLQIIILNNIFLFQIATPYLYILPLLLLPLTINRQVSLIIGFLIGLVIDFFEGTGGVFAASTLIIAYLRPLYLSIAFGLAYEQMTIKFHEQSFTQKLVYASLMVITHHLFLYFIEAFSLNNIVMILEKTALSSILNIILIMIIFTFLSKNKKTV